ncbi:transposase InsF for insertion sequence IS3A/B/C/D/E/fA [Salmonella enterica subsp. enterica serovar Agona str. 39.O.03]|nr:transposase InsF for insertion sequence IS3A/B/C/D/E/fA [Salmonella enterica subsp. enterica serovar Agona str. 39.O.03]
MTQTALWCATPDGYIGWYVWHQRRHQINQRQQFRLVCDNVVREAFSDANSAMVRHA